MGRLLLIAGLGFCLLATAVRAEDIAGNTTVESAGASATDQLLLRLNRITHLQGDFEQRQFAEDGAVLVESSGSFRLLRPVFFIWQIKYPDSQLIVANARYLWHHDMDLQTVTRQPVAGNVEVSPLQILGGDETVLRNQYSVTRDAEETFTLVPVDSAHGFRKLTVSFIGDAIGRMDIVDKLGQRVAVDFTRVDTQTPLSESDFEFTPPSGDVDLFYYDD